MHPDLVYLSIPSKNNEIIHSLRAVEKHGIGFGKLVIVGHCPKQLKPDIHIPHITTRSGWYKHRDMFEKISLASTHPEVSEHFIRMSDDYFFSEQIDFSTLPTYIREYDLFAHGSMNQNNKNNMVLTATAKVLRSKGYPCESYDLHAPMPMQKTKFLQAAKPFDWSKPLSLSIRSIYGNYNKIFGIVKKDVKFARYYDAKIVSKHPIWSTGDMFWCLKTMKELYPEKSRWEI